MKKYIIGGAALLFLVPSMAFAITNFDGLLKQIGEWINLIIPLLVGLAVLFFFYGLLKFFMAGGDEEARTAAKDLMIWGIIIVFVMSTFWGLVSFLQGTFQLNNVPTFSRGPQDIPDIPIK